MFLFLGICSLAQDSLTSSTAPTSQASELNGKNFQEKFLGEITPLDLAVLCVWAYIGVLINIVFEYLDRTKNKNVSPDKFELNYWWKDNKLKFFVSLLLIPVGIIFSQQVFNVAPSNWNAILIGGGADRIIIIIKNRRKATTAAASATAEDTSESTK